MTFFNTYGNVRDFVYAHLEQTPTTAPDYKLIGYMEDALNTLVADLSWHHWFRSTWNIDVESGVTEIDLPDDLSLVYNLVIIPDEVEVPWQAAGPDYDGVPSIQALASYGEGATALEIWEAEWRARLEESAGISANVSAAWFVESGKIKFTTPLTSSSDDMSIRIHGVRSPDATFFTTSFEGNDQVITWQPIDLPIPYRAVFAKAVLSEAYLGEDDPNLASVWASMAEQERTTINGRELRQLQGHRPGDSGSLRRMNSKPVPGGCGPRVRGVYLEGWGDC